MANVTVDHPTLWGILLSPPKLGCLIAVSKDVLGSNTCTLAPSTADTSLAAVKDKPTVWDSEYGIKSGSSRWRGRLEVTLREKNYVQGDVWPVGANGAMQADNGYVVRMKLQAMLTGIRIKAIPSVCLQVEKARAPAANILMNRCCIVVSMCQRLGVEESRWKLGDCVNNGLVLGHISAASGIFLPTVLTAANLLAALMA